MSAGFFDPGAALHFADRLTDPAILTLQTDPRTLGPLERGVTLRSQFPVRALNVTRNVQQATGQGLGNVPNTAFSVSRDPDRVTVALRFVAVFDGDPRPRVAREAINSLADWNEQGVFPIVLLTWGSQHHRVQIVSIDADSKHGVDRFTQSEREYVARITFVEASQLRADSVADQVGEPSTTYHEVRIGDTWASIAAEHYGDPMASVRLARANRHLMELSPGDVVRVLPATHSLMVGPPAPHSIALRTIPQADIQAAALAAFGGKSGGVAWDDLDPRFTDADWSG